MEKIVCKKCGKTNNIYFFEIEMDKNAKFFIYCKHCKSKIFDEEEKITKVATNGFEEAMKIIQQMIKLKGGE